LIGLLVLLVGLDSSPAGRLAPGLWLMPLLWAVTLLGSQELLALARAEGIEPLAWPVHLGNGLIPAAAALPMLAQAAGRKMNECWAWQAAWLALAAALAVVLVGEMRRFARPGRALAQVAVASLALIYVGGLASFWVWLRRWPDGQAGAPWGMVALASMVLIVKMADTGAFVVGKNWGRRKLTPILSPGKTWEGAAGGVATAAATSWLFFTWGAPVWIGAGYVAPSGWAAAVYGILLALAGMAGDLAESLLKRDAQRKDSSTWLKGLGGVLDIVDALLLAGPVAWLCWEAGLVGPGR
jgi:phosphatidate cytidylyltransferase